jgi:sec-independent protein translocase protein TatB
MMREAEMEEMQKAWAAQNEAIMKATALPDPLGNSMAGIDPASWALPDPLANDPHQEAAVAPDAAAMPPPEAAPEAPKAAETAKKPRAPRKKKAVEPTAPSAS